MRVHVIAALGLAHHQREGTELLSPDQDLGDAAAGRAVVDEHHADFGRGDRLECDRS